MSPAPAGTPASPFLESDDDRPPPEEENPDAKALLAEANAIADHLLCWQQQLETMSATTTEGYLPFAGTPAVGEESSGGPSALRRAAHVQLTGHYELAAANDCLQDS